MALLIIEYANSWHIRTCINLMYTHICETTFHAAFMNEIWKSHYIKGIVRTNVDGQGCCRKNMESITPPNYVPLTQLNPKPLLDRKCWSQLCHRVNQTPTDVNRPHWCVFTTPVLCSHAPKLVVVVGVIHFVCIVRSFAVANINHE